MNSAILNRNSLLITYGLPALMIIFATSLSFTPYLAQYPELAAAITFDLVLSAPLLYFFLIRKKNIPKITAVSVFIGGLTIASLVLPGEQQFHLGMVKFWILPLVEFGVLAFLGFSVFQAVKKYRALKESEPDVLKLFREICHEKLSFSVPANAIAFELSVLYFAFIRWKKTEPGENRFTQHKKNGIIALFAAIIFLVTVETIVLHILIAMWSPLIAWIITASSLYVSLQIFAHIKVVYLRPTEIKGGKLLIRYGLFGDTEIDLENIAEIKLTSDRAEKTEGVRQLALLKELEQFNTKIELKQEETLIGFYGIKSKFKTLLLYVDENEKLKKHVDFGF